MLNILYLKKTCAVFSLCIMPYYLYEEQETLRGWLSMIWPCCHCLILLKFSCTHRYSLIIGNTNVIWKVKRTERFPSSSWDPSRASQWKPYSACNGCKLEHKAVAGFQIPYKTQAPRIGVGLLKKEITSEPWQLNHHLNNPA